MEKYSVIDAKLFDGKTLIGEHVSFDLPSLNFGTSEAKGSGIMGIINVPSTGQLEAMEFAVKLQGLGKNAALLCRPGVHELEGRFMQDVLKIQSGKMKPEGCKVFVTGIFIGTERGTVEHMSFIEGSAKFSVLRYQEFVDGEETILADPRNYIFRVNGFDYMEEIRAFMA